ncbi:DUF47 family protein [Pyrobaculum calidifontis]|uniref:Phosphate transport regulator n=1 Tax=Pyrobaculum calidifontis (strain DSM 21063 / JCM 11548 / VA1) TaxID=410359 RepID=A3MX67_PYRCJ|nr:DUF47 family protein [Pyrobaculum calidifontis]ABO09234.1 protein of unknown function DUF47 [Pyrobaculum calidifontis JCM 11548]
MQRIKRIFTSGVEDVKAKIASHLELSRQSLEVLLQLLSARATAKSDVDEAMRKITALEREGDEIIRGLVDEVTQGAVVPTVTNLVLILLDNVDNVLDLIYFAVKEIRRGFHLWQKESVYAIVANEVREIFNLIKSMLEYFQKMLSAGKVEEVKHYARIVSSLEEEIDEIKEDVLDKIYGLELTAVEFNHLVTLVFTADRIADNIQDAAYHLVTVVSSA